jgi:hypothetical protein
MPSQSVAACASRQTIICLNAAALLPLDDMVNLPITGQVTVNPAARLENYRVATKMTMAFGLLPDAS